MLGRKSAARGGQTEVRPAHVEQVGGIAAIEDRELRAQADAFRIQPEQAIGDRVKGAAPGQRNGRVAIVFGEGRAYDAAGTASHFLGRPPAEGHEQDAAGIRAGLHCGSPDYAKRAIDWGYDFVTLSNDVRLLAGACSAQVAQMRERLGETAAPAESGAKPGY